MEANVDFLLKTIGELEVKNRMLVIMLDKTNEELEELKKEKTDVLKEDGIM